MAAVLCDSASRLNKALINQVASYVFRSSNKNTFGAVALV